MTRKKGKDEMSIDEKNNFKDLDLSKLLDTSKDKDFLFGKTDKYTWSQNEREIELCLDIPSSFNFIAKKDIVCSIKSKSIKLAVCGNFVLEGEFYSLVDPNECSWQIGIRLDILPIIIS